MGSKSRYFCQNVWRKFSHVDAQVRKEDTKKTFRPKVENNQKFKFGGKSRFFDRN